MPDLGWVLSWDPKTRGWQAESEHCSWDKGPKRPSVRRDERRGWELREGFCEEAPCDRDLKDTEALQGVFRGLGDHHTSPWSVPSAGSSCSMDSF